jgi:16S rRNA (uracil1498-N3)-methyltransferase
MRFYVAEPLVNHSEITLPEGVAHHLVRVLRRDVGERFFLFNGQGGAFEAELTEAGKKTSRARLLNFLDEDRESPLHTHLGQVMSRGERMDYVIQKATELGVNEITPLSSERCELKLRGEDRADKKLEHWRQVAISACEQCGRNRLPVINPPLALADWLAQINVEQRFVLAPSIGGGPATSPIPASAALLIGPEGGLSEAEIAQAMARQFQPWQLGPRVFRTETAPVAALTVLQLLYGDLSRQS